MNAIKEQWMSYAKEKIDIVENLIQELLGLQKKLNKKSDKHKQLHDQLRHSERQLEGMKDKMDEANETLLNSITIVVNQIIQLQSAIDQIEAGMNNRSPDEINKVEVNVFGVTSSIFQEYYRKKRSVWQNLNEKFQGLQPDIDPVPEDRAWEIIDFTFGEKTPDDSENPPAIKKIKIARRKLRQPSDGENVPGPSRSKTVAPSSAITEDDERFAKFLEEEAARADETGAIGEASSATLETRLTNVKDNPVTSQDIQPKEQRQPALTSAKVGNKAAVSNSEVSDQMETGGTGDNDAVLQELNLNSGFRSSRRVAVSRRTANSTPKDSRSVASSASVPKSSRSANSFAPNATKEVAMFSDFQLPLRLVFNLDHRNIFHPHVLQKKSMVDILLGKNVIVEGGSKTGKTTTGVVCAVSAVNSELKEPQVLYIHATEPTRELETLIQDVGNTLVTYSCSSDRVFDNRAQIILGTANRLRERIEQKTLKVDAIRMFVIDGATKILNDKGRPILKFLENLFRVAPKVQVVALTETRSKGVEALLQFLNKCEYVTENSPDKEMPLRTERQSEAGPDLEIIYSSSEEQSSQRMKDMSDLVRQQYHVVTSDEDKTKFINELADGMESDLEQAIIFCNSEKKADWLVKKLKEHNQDLDVCSVHGQLGNREHCLNMLRKKAMRVLVTTDFLTKWNPGVIDVPMIVNYEFPNNPDQYIKRLNIATKSASKKTAKETIMITLVSSDGLTSLKRVAAKYKMEVNPVPSNSSTSILSNGNSA